MRGKPVAEVKHGLFKVPIYKDGDRYFYARYRSRGSSRRERIRRNKLPDLKKAIIAIIKDIELGVPDLGNLTVDQSLVVAEVLRRNITIGDLDKIQKQSDVEVEDAVAGFRASKANDSGPYQQSIKTHLGQFVKAFPGRMLASFGTVELERWLVEVAPAWRSRKNKRACLVSLFNWARNMEYLPMGALHAAERLTKVKAPKKNAPISTWSPEEMRKILEGVSLDYLPWVILTAFGGLRTEELFPWDRSIGEKKSVLQWEDIHWNAGEPHIYVSDEVAKEDTAREIPLTSQLVEWLKPFSHRVGQVCPNRKPEKAQLVRPQRERGIENPDRRPVTKIIADAVGVAYKRNAFRHSFGTYAVKQKKSVGEVALLMGNSEGVVKRHYYNVKERTDADAKEWFGIMPKQVKRELRVVA